MKAFGGNQPGGATWDLHVEGLLKSGTPGKIFDYAEDGTPEKLNKDVFQVAQLHVSAGGADRIFLQLANPIDIPAGLIKADKSGFRSESELNGELAAAVNAARASLVRQCIASLQEVERRFQVVEIAATGAVFLGVASPFGSGSAFAGGSIKLRLFDQLQLEQNPAQIKFSGRCEVAGTARLSIGAVTRQAALVCILEMDGGASVRVDVDDFNISLPEFDLPSLDLPSIHNPLKPKGGLKGLAGAFQRLVNKVEAAKIEASFEQDPAPAPGEEARLALRVRPTGTGGIDWAVVAHDFVDGDWADSQIEAKLAKFKAVIKQAGATTVATVDAMRFASTATKTVFEGTITVKDPLTVKDDKSRFGPLEISWEGLVVVPSVSTGSQSLLVDVSFRRLLVRVHDDPSAFLAFSGKLQLSPKGIHVDELHLVEPYPIELIAKASAAAAREAASIVKVMFSLVETKAKQAEEIIVILGKIAAAVARAAVFVAGEIVEGVAELVSKALSGIAELIAAALKELRRLGENTPHFVVEIRVATDPIELRQILITLPPASSSKPIAGGALGVEVAIEAGWQPGLLIDFVSQPGAYLTLTHDVSTAGSPLKAATVSTDLWLKRGTSGTSTTTPVRDADGDKGDRADKPLLGLDLLLLNSADADDLMLVVAGLNRGNPVFLQWLDGKTAPLPLPVPPSDIKAKTAPGAFAFQPIKSKFDVAVQFDKKRILPLLGMGEPGKEKSSGPSFLDKLQNSLSNVIWVKDTRTKASIADRQAEVDLILGLKAAGVETEVTLQAKLSLDNFDVTVEAGKLFPIVSQRIEEHALGLVWVVEQKDKDERLANKPVEMFRLGFAGGQSGFELNAGKARMELRFDGLSSDGKGVVFDVETFKISAGGLDLKAKVRDAAVQMNGIDVPFRFTAGSLEIKAGRLVSASIAGRGSLPPKLIGDADCTVALTFGQDASEGIVLQSGKVELDKKGDPIVCHASRFTLTITDLDIAFVKDNGYHFYYLVTGSLRFTPKSGEFESGLLQFLDGVEMNLERTPLSADPRVLLKHISFQKALNPKKTFNLFNLFTFEIRGFGYHPASPKFGGDPAVNISGQIKFVEIGDVMQPKIDFHGLWIAPPAKGQSLPRIRADGLGIELNLKGSIHIRGAVLAVDPGTTVEGTELAPPGYNTYGFLGEGELAIPGWGDLAASLGFLELERQDQPGERRKSFFFYAEMRKLAIEIPAVVWTFYLREVGFGFGFRYTLEALAAADRAPSIPKLISSLDEISKRQGDLHKFSAWRPEVEGDHVTLALKGAIQAYPAETSWDEEAEEAAENPFLFDLVAAIRSDFTLFMGLRGWLGTNYIDYLNDKDGLRSNPGLRGYLYISAPHKRLLARAIGDSKGYIGNRIPALAKTGDSEPPLRKALRSIDWSVTLFIKPGLFHYEMGWPDQLVVRLMDAPNMRVTVRGGMIFRAADDGLLWGYNIEADAFFRFGGSLQIGPVGIAGEASLDAHLVARVICYLSWRIKGSMVYGLIALDASLAISIRAWLEVDLGFTSFTIRISFSRSLQLSASVEMVISTEGVGAQVHARVAISAFGCTLSVSIGFTLGASQLAEARARVQRFMAMSITAEEPDAAPAVTSSTGDKRIENDAKNAEAPAMAPAPEQVVKPNPDAKLKPSQFRAQFGSNTKATDFWLVLHRAGSDDDCYALLVPREPEKPEKSGFYAAPTIFKEKSGERREDQPTYHLVIPGGWVGPDIERWDGVNQEPVTVDAAHADIMVGWNQAVQTEQPGGEKVFKLAHLFDECFLTDTVWHQDKDDPSKPLPYRRTLAPWREPPLRRHTKAVANVGATEQERIAERDTVQRARAASAAENPIVEAVHQARSTTLSMFLEQFVGLAETGLRKEAYAHVSHLGLVFRGKAADLERLAELTIEKLEIDTEGSTVPVHKAGSITVFNGKNTWFEQQDPVLASGRSAVAADGIKLDWKLQLAWAGKDEDPEHFLHHYEIRRTIEGLEFTPRIVKVKPAATIGGRDDEGNVKLLQPDWQFSDDLADISADLRAALLPARDESQALQAAINWATVFGDNDTVSVTYTVTPVDIAGTRGLPKSFLVDVNKPQPPIRPAEAELRFVVTAMGQGNKPDPWTSDQPPVSSLSAVIALRDPFRPRDPDDPKESKRDFVPDNPTIRVLRNYRLIADPESIRPSGHYGTDGLTDRRLGPPSGFGPTADELIWILNYREKDLPDSGATPPFKEGKRLFVDMRNKDGKVPSTTKIDALEPDQDTIAKFPLWRRLDGMTGVGTVDDILFQAPPVRKPQPADGTDPEGAGPKDNFLKSLWRRENEGMERIATRFSLETFHTVMDYTDPKNPRHLATFNSRRTPVAVEVRVEHFPRNATPAAQDIGLLRPEAFEWPVHLEMPAHQPGQVRAESGFARFRVPPADATGALGLLTSDTPTPPTLVRDAERRVLTQISFAASSQFGPDSATGINQIHQTAVAGYDVHELDFDDLARLDTSKDVAIDSNATTWRRSRRVARVERVSPEMARLMPDHNRDWQGWEAHYPSETWRLVKRTQGRAGQSQPIRAPWYSAAESTLHFADRVPRIRLFPTAPEGAITDLMRNGRPMTLRARFVAAANSRAEKTLLSIARSVDNALADCEWQWVALAGGIGAQGRLVFYPVAGSCEVGLTDGDFRFTPQLVREALLGFGWTASEAIVEKFGKDRAALDGLAIELSGHTVVGGTVIETGKSIESLSFNSFRHPLLEEVLGELEYSYSAATSTLYRRYVVTPQSVKPGDAKDLARFLSATVAEKDPYGWAALQQLGLATTLRLYDRDQDRFVSPKELLALIDPVMRVASERYRVAFGENSTGQPFVDVLLKPGSDRVAGPFNAVLRTSSVEDERQALNLDDDGLALAQLSLRPRPARFWKYYLAEMAWAKATWPSALIASGHPLKDNARPDLGVDLTKWRTVSIAGYDLCFENQTGKPTFEVLRSVDGSIVEVRPPDAPPAGGMDPVPASLQAITWPKSRTLSSELDPNLSLFFRVTGEETIVLGDVLKLRARIVTTTLTEGDKSAKTTEEQVLFDGLNGLKQAIIKERSNFPEVPDDLADFPSKPFTDGSADEHAPVLVELDSPAAFPGKVTRRSPFELFEEIKADAWSAKAATPEHPEAGAPKATDASMAAFASLWQNLRSALPDFAWPAQRGDGELVSPTYPDYQQVMGAYLSWSQRFLDHGATAGEAPPLPYALAALIKAQPWHLAADSAGWVTLSFLHADRWAHARAYAVRPTPRYQNLALGAGYYSYDAEVDQQDSERLVTKDVLGTPLKDIERFKKPIGYALAVSPRTERIEPPVILGSRLMPGTAGDAKQIWEVVVARHGEEALAFSNRSLFARLGSEGTALTFAREYRDRNWPGRLTFAHGADKLPDVELYPKRFVGPLGRPVRDSEIDGKMLGDIAVVYPSLWKGADIWRIDQLPPHYRVTALAVARAGLVVSNVVSAVQDETPRRELRGRESEKLLDSPAIEIERDGSGKMATIRVTGLRLVAHADLTVEGAWPWIATDPDPQQARKDIVWWPDPNVTYTLLRYGTATAAPPPDQKPSLMEEEDAVVQLVAQADAQAELGTTPVPIVVRCRGPRYEPKREESLQPGQEPTSAQVAGWPTVTTTEIQKVFGSGSPKAGREFRLSFALEPRADGLIQTQTARYAPTDPPDEPVRDEFNETAEGFAEIRAERQLTLRVRFDGLHDVAAVKQRFADTESTLTTAAGSLDKTDKDNVVVADALRGMAANLKAEADAIAATAPLPDLARLGRARYALVALMTSKTDDEIFTPINSATMSLAMSRTNAEILTVFDVPTEEEADAVLALDKHPFGKRGGALWRLCRERLLGAADGFRIRAVDRRNAIDMPQQKPGSAASTDAWSAVGEIDADVTPPRWTGFASEG